MPETAELTDRAPAKTAGVPPAETISELMLRPVTPET